MLGSPRAGTESTWGAHPTSFTSNQSRMVVLRLFHRVANHFPQVRLHLPLIHMDHLTHASLFSAVDILAMEMKIPNSPSLEIVVY